MVDPINLRKFRKRSERAKKDKLADENRKVHGISSHIRKASKATNKVSNIRLDGQKLDKET